MPPEARLYEPLVALDGGSDGLDVQRRIIAGARRWLAPHGRLLSGDQPRSGVSECCSFPAARTRGPGRYLRRARCDRGHRLADSGWQSRHQLRWRAPGSSCAPVRHRAHRSSGFGGDRDGLFRARQPDTQLQRVFGGQVLAQALVAAARTVAVTRVLHSMHAYPASPAGPTFRSSTTSRRCAMEARSHPGGWWLDKVAR